MTKWREILDPYSARWEAGALSGFADPGPVTDGPCITALASRECLLCSGPDVRRFLQGQLTCDVQGVNAESSTLGACCTVKGRMVANFRMLQAGEDLLLVLPAGQAAALREALARFLPFYKATLEPTDDWLGMALWGEGVQDMLRAQAVHVPDSINRVAACEDGLLVRVHGAGVRYELWTPARSAAGAWERFSAGCRRTGEAEWQLEDIRAGLGWITPALEETLVPQMLNLQHVDAVSFKKGCYTGQEIVARMQYRGTLKKCAFRLSCADAGATADPGSAVCTSKGDTAVGQVVQAAPTGTGLELLAVLRVESARGGDLHLGSADGPALSLCDLPYSPITD